MKNKIETEHRDDAPELEEGGHEDGSQGGGFDAVLTGFGDGGSGPGGELSI